LSEKIFSAIEYFVSVDQISFSRGSLQKKLQQADLASVNFNYLNRALKRLEQRGLISVYGNKADNYRLTEKGYNYLFGCHLRNLRKTNINQWDGLWRLIIFDIPENKKIAREALRRKLKYFNFYPLQKSVFAFPFECEREIERLADFFGVVDCVEIILAKSLGRKEKEIRHFFNI